MVVVVGVACVYAARVSLSGPLPPMPLPAVGSGLPMAIGIFILSLGGHAALPGIYASMAEPQRFDHMLDVSLAASASDGPRARAPCPPPSLNPSLKAPTS